MLDNRYDPRSCLEVLAAYPPDCQPAALAPWPAGGGFSGSQVWKLDAQRGPLCLRRWPREHPDAQRLRFIHRVLDSAHRGGFRCLPVPIRMLSGDSYVQLGGHLWELSPWLRGTADGGPGGKPAAAPRVAAALEALAAFHQAVAAEPANLLPDAPAPGIARRLALLDELQAGGLQQLRAEIAYRGDCWPELAARSAIVFEMYQRAADDVGKSLRQVAGLTTPQRPCVRDIHRQHVLIEGDAITGIIDFGAMQPDNVSCDVARLLGSMAGDCRELWEIGLAGLERVLPLSDVERRLVTVYDESSVLLSGMQWLRWVFVEGRTFANPEAVLARFDAIAARLATLAGRKRGISV